MSYTYNQRPMRGAGRGGYSSLPPRNAPSRGLPQRPGMTSGAGISGSSLYSRRAADPVYKYDIQSNYTDFSTPLNSHQPATGSVPYSRRPYERSNPTLLERPRPSPPIDTRLVNSLRQTSSNMYNISDECMQDINDALLKDRLRRELASKSAGLRRMLSDPRIGQGPVGSHRMSSERSYMPLNPRYSQGPLLPDPSARSFIQYQGPARSGGSVMAARVRGSIGQRGGRGTARGGGGGRGRAAAQGGRAPARGKGKKRGARGNVPPATNGAAPEGTKNKNKKKKNRGVNRNYREQQLTRPWVTDALKQEITKKFELLEAAKKAATDEAWKVYQDQKVKCDEMNSALRLEYIGSHPEFDVNKIFKESKQAENEPKNVDKEEPEKMDVEESEKAANEASEGNAPATASDVGVPAAASDVSAPVAVSENSELEAAPQDSAAVA